jgi:hypothetical protein
MATVGELDDCGTEISAVHPKRRPQGGRSDHWGGTMEDVLKRLGAVELSVSEIKTQVTTLLPHLATKSDVYKLRADMNAGFGDLKTRDATAMCTKFEPIASQEDDRESEILPERTKPRIAYSKVTGYPHVTARPGVPKVTSEDVKKMLEDFP